MAKKQIDGVTVEAKSIITSLKIIKTVCEDTDGNCGKCPFYDELNGGCSFSDMSPCNWKINDTTTTWRALL